VTYGRLIQSEGRVSGPLDRRHGSGETFGVAAAARLAASEPNRSLSGHQLRICLSIGRSAPVDQQSKVSEEMAFGLLFLSYHYHVDDGVRFRQW
jgi:hypothetical protein